MKVEKKILYSVIHFHNVAILTLSKGMNPLLRYHEFQTLGSRLNGHYSHAFSLKKNIYCSREDF